MSEAGLKRATQHVLLLGVEPQSLLNFRAPLIAQLVLAGHHVTVASLPPSQIQHDALSALGAKVSSVSFSRAGMNPIKDIKTLSALTRLFKNHRPDTVIAYTAKPVVYGAIAARLTGVTSFVAMITGLGYSFVEGPEPARRIAKSVASVLYWIALRFSRVVIFQNPDDLKTFQSMGLLRPKAMTGLVNGSGVDLNHFVFSEPPQKPVFLMVARLLADKGVREYAQASRRLRKALPEVRTLLLGPLDPSPNSVSKSELDNWVSEGMEYLGVREDVRPAIAMASVAVLPSYREGTPRSILEAMAMGRAIITTDAPGCRETVDSGRNGCLVPPRNAEALFQAMLEFSTDAEKVASMGVASREYANQKFEANAVAKSVIKLAGL